MVRNHFGQYCTGGEPLRSFPTGSNASQAAATRSRDACERYCVMNSTCNSCTMHCGTGLLQPASLLHASMHTSCSFCTSMISVHSPFRLTSPGACGEGGRGLGEGWHLCSRDFHTWGIQISSCKHATFLAARGTRAGLDVDGFGPITSNTSYTTNNMSNTTNTTAW